MHNGGFQQDKTQQDEPTVDDRLKVAQLRWSCEDPNDYGWKAQADCDLGRSRQMPGTCRQGSRDENDECGRSQEQVESITRGEINT